MLVRLSLASLVLVAGCASEAPKPAPQQVAAATPASAPASEATQHCYKTVKTGSNFPQTICESDTEASRQGVSDVVNDISRQTGQTQQMMGRGGAGH
jgi:hypothetical protein